MSGFLILVLIVAFLVPVILSQLIMLAIDLIRLIISIGLLLKAKIDLWTP